MYIFLSASTLASEVIQIYILKGSGALVILSAWDYFFPLNLITKIERIKKCSRESTELWRHSSLSYWAVLSQFPQR